MATLRRRDPSPQSTPAAVSPATPPPTVQVEVKNQAPAAPSSPSVEVASSASTAPAVIPPAAPVAADVMPGDPMPTGAATPAQKQLVGLHLNEAELVKVLQSQETLDQVSRANPALAKDAINAAITYVRDSSDKKAWEELMKCTPKSVVDSVSRLASIGLKVSQATGTAYLVPRWDKVEQSNKATPVPGVHGYGQLVWASGMIANVANTFVRAQDRLDMVEGSSPDAKVYRNTQPDPTKPNPIVAVFALVTPKESFREKQLRVNIITEKETPNRVAGMPPSRQWFLSNGEQVNTSRMSGEAATVLVPLRAVYRDIARTWLHDNPTIKAALEMEDTSYRTGEEIAGAQPSLRVRQGRPGPTVESASVATVDESSAQTNGHTNGHSNGQKPGQVRDPLAVAEERAAEDLGQGANVGSNFRRLRIT